MELVVHLNSKKFINDFIEIGIKNFIVGTKYFSCRQALSLDYQELKDLNEQLKDKKLWVLVNALIEEHNLDELVDHLAKLNEIKIAGILFQDFSVLQICKENNYNFEMVYSPDTLNTNQATLNYLKTLGINSAFLAREIPLDEKMMIAKNTDLKTMIQVHGVEYMAYSKRKLLSNYFKETGIDHGVLIDDNLTIQANAIDYRCHIYEDKFGCHILSEKQLCTLDILSNFSCFDYLYFESLFIDDLKVVEIVSLYQEAINSISKETYGKVSKELISVLHQIENNVEYHHSFMFDATVYKIDDVRKREENERSK
ncbi:peptidase U32 family protein [Thomasclavelia spiroformis]|uniref:peptidase U32 family protein n=1 Tax=Thomasclavelia spiroformis TaxID=29348 RepID=UPI00241DF80F|nr:U32 family peptidase [Thomasclavelia spiroformis]MBS6115428.1 U32 family peptidase [Thomasclavelia spiroformis]